MRRVSRSEAETYPELDEGALAGHAPRPSPSRRKRGGALPLPINVGRGLFFAAPYSITTAVPLTLTISMLPSLPTT